MDSLYLSGESTKINNFIIMFSFPFSYECMVEFFRSDMMCEHIVSPLADRTHACYFFCFMF